MLQRALAARTIAIDRRRLGAADAAPLPEASPPVDEAAPVTRVRWPYRERDTASTRVVAVPATVGLGARVAVRALHRSGLHVVAHGIGTVVRTSPDAGSTIPPGGTVQLWTTE
jgi:hypothetical protein